jgi:hypothetical protein
MKLDFNDKLVGGFNYEFVRGVSTASAGVAELGECVETMSRVRNGDFESWIEHWGATANRVSAFAQQQFDAGDKSVKGVSQQILTNSFNSTDCGIANAALNQVFGRIPGRLSRIVD